MNEIINLIYLMAGCILEWVWCLGTVWEGGGANAEIFGNFPCPCFWDNATVRPLGQYLSVSGAPQFHDAKKTLSLLPLLSISSFAPFP